MVVHNPLVRSVVIVAITWWLILTLVGVWMYAGVFFSLPGLTAAVSYIIYGLFTALLGVAAGVTFVVVAQIRERMVRAKGLKAAGRLGMLCTLGGMPIPVHPAMRQVPGPLPEWFLAETEHGKVLVDWASANADKHPAHAQALMALLRVFCSYRTLPASHVPGGHGGKTLIDHTMRVAARMLREAPKFRYEGLVTRYGREPWGDAAFTFDSQDPMIPIVGVAHDIGKLQTFVRNGEGKVISAAPKHDLVGSRMLATMDEIKALPIDDQAALHMAVSHYHHPSDYPLDSQGRIGSDRSVALMMLLIKADKWSGKEEAGQSLTPDQYAAYLRYVQDLGEELSTDEEDVIRAAEAAQQQGPTSGARGPAASTPITDERMRDVLIKIITNPTVVFTAMPKGNGKPVGQVCNTNYPEWAWEALATGQPLEVEQQQQLSDYIERLVVLHEQRLRLTLAKALGLSEVKKLGDGRAAIIVHALRVLHEMGVLYTDTDGGHISPESAIYKVDMVNHKTGASIAKWTAILLRPVAELEALAKGGIHPSLVKVVMPVWRDRMQRVQVEGVEATEPVVGEEYLHDRIVLEEDDGPDVEDDAPAGSEGDSGPDAGSPESADGDVSGAAKPAAPQGQTLDTPRRGWAEFDAGPDDFQSFPVPGPVTEPEPVHAPTPAPEPVAQPQQPADRHSHTPEQVQTATESLIASVRPADAAAPTTPTTRAQQFAEGLKKARSKPGLDRYKK